MFKKLFLLLFLTIPFFVKGQISSISSTKPSPASTIVIQYNPYAENAKFSINDDVYAIIWQTDQNGEYCSTFKKMKRDQKNFRCDILAGDSSAFYSIHFITLSQNSFDIQADLSFMIFGLDGNPVRNAHCSNMQINNYEEEKEAELKLYPDNYAVYRTLWFNYKFQKPDQYKSLISKDLLSLAKINETSADLLYAEAYGNILLHNYQEAIAVTNKLISMYPKRLYTSSTLSSFLYELFSTNNTGQVYQQIKNLTETYALNNPELNSVWIMLYSYSFSDSCIQKVCEHWMNLQPDDPSPYYFESFIHNKNSDLSRSEQLCQKAISLILNGKLRLYSDITGKISSMELVDLYHTLAEIKFKQEKYGEALAAIKASQTISDNPYSQLFQTEGDIWFKLKNYIQAEQSYFKALKTGLSEAKNDIQKCYEITHNDLDGFNSYFSDKLSNSNKVKEEKKDPAPDFNINDRNNVNYSLEKLKGKVIVMNFWFTGCGPCKAETPYLNDLVKKYKKKNVVFLGFALDDDIKILNSYLKEYPFKYIILPKAIKVAEDYKITNYPTQVIISKKGQIVTKIIGGGDKVSDKISTIIDNQLKN